MVAQGDSSRDVVIRLLVQADKASGAAAIREAGKIAQKAQEAVNKTSLSTAKKQADDKKKTLRDLGSAAKQLLKQQAAAEKQIERQRVSEAKDSLREIRAERKRLNAETIRDAKRTASEQAKAQRQVVSEHKRATGQFETQNEKAAESSKQVLSGVVSLGRGIAMLGLIGEKDTQKLLIGLIKIQAAFDILRGSIETVQGLVRAWRAYQAAVTAAAAARTALTAAQVAGAAAGGASVAGAAAGGAARTGLVAGAGATAGAFLAGGAGLITGAAILALGATAAAAYAIVNPNKAGTTFANLAVRGREFFGIEPGPTGLGRRDELGASLSALQVTQRRLDATTAASQRRGQLRQIREAGAAQRADLSARERAGRTFTRPEARRALEAARAGAAGTRRQREIGGPDAPSSGDLKRADSLHAEALQRFIGLRREENQIARNTAQTTLNAAKQEVQLRRDALRAAQQQGQTALERFGAASRSEQTRFMRAERARRNLKKGERLAPAHEAILRQFGGARQIRGLARRARDVAEKFFGSEEAGIDILVGKQEQRAQRSLDLAIETQITAQVDFKKFEAGVKATMGPLIEELKEIVARAIAELKTESEAAEGRAAAAVTFLHNAQGRAAAGLV